MMQSLAHDTREPRKTFIEIYQSIKGVVSSKLKSFFFFFSLFAFHHSFTI